MISKIQAKTPARMSTKIPIKMPTKPLSKNIPENVHYNALKHHRANAYEVTHFLSKMFLKNAD
jgi:hypothetical protein